MPFRQRDGFASTSKGRHPYGGASLPASTPYDRPHSQPEAISERRGNDSLDLIRSEKSGQVPAIAVRPALGCRSSAMTVRSVSGLHPVQGKVML
jgi:hypothetical protein